MVEELLDWPDIPSVQYSSNFPSTGIKLTRKIMKMLTKSKIQQLAMQIASRFSKPLNGKQQIQLLEPYQNDHICVVYSSSSGCNYITLLFLSEI